MPTNNISSLAQRRAAIIDTDAQALEVARALAADFAREASQRDRERRLPLPELERYSLSGLWGITVPREHGGAGVSRVCRVWRSGPALPSRRPASTPS